MPRRLRISAEGVRATATLDDSRTATVTWAILPTEGAARTWGDEVRPASPVNVFGRVGGDPTVFKRVRAGTTVRREPDQGGPR